MARPGIEAAPVSLNDTELAKAYKKHLRSYCLRMEYFKQLPEVFRTVPAKELAKTPEAYGITKCEFDQYLQDRAEHIRQGYIFGEVCKERRRRIYDKAKAKAATVKDTSGALKRLLAKRPAYERYSGANLSEYLKQREKTLDKMAEHDGRFRGLIENLQATMDGFISGVRKD